MGPDLGQVDRIVLKGKGGYEGKSLKVGDWGRSKNRRLGVTRYDTNHNSGRRVRVTFWGTVTRDVDNTITNYFRRNGTKFDPKLPANL